jgi:hypothetical protein
VGSTLLLGFVLGMRHALDADHLAAVGSLAGGSGGGFRFLRLGLSWALGHSTTLVILGSAVLIANGTIPPLLALALEGLVGLLLILLGLGVVRRVIWMPSAGRKADHDHRQKGALTRRAALVGVVHGLAGSAALVLLALTTIDSLWIGMGYIALFGLGTVAGMGLLSCLLALPLRLLASRLSLHYSCALALLGLWSIGLGGVLLYENARAVFP